MGLNTVRVSYRCFTALSIISNVKLVGPQLVLVIPTYKPMDPVIPRVIFGILSPAHTFNPESRPDFSLTSRIPSFKQGKSRILKSPLGPSNFKNAKHNLLPSTLHR